MTVSLTLLLDIADKAVGVRAAQKRYFKERTQSALAKSKRLERELDALLEEFDPAPKAASDV